MAYRYFIKLKYNGQHYHGWQIQPNATSVQACLNNALKLILKCDIETTGCGRTDTGVHARQFYAHFDLETPISDCDHVVQRLDAMRLPGILCEEILEVPSELHARFSATSRSYEYHIMHKRDPFLEGYAHHVFGKLDFDKMNAAAAKLLGYNDFSAFSKSNTQVHTTICTVTEAIWKMDGSNAVFHISADRFLRNMVRAIVGTLLDIGLGKMKVDELERIIQSHDRSEAGCSVPAHGLYLTQIEYPPSYQLR
jgi:tRNA pseudouridine38-40 synthase